MARQATLRVWKLQIEAGRLVITKMNVENEMLK